MDDASLRRLKLVHPDLVRVVRRSFSEMKPPLSFRITCGIRTLEEQKKLLAAGATKTLRSRHLPGRTNRLSHAVDLVAVLDGKVRWDWPLYHQLATAMKTAANMEKVPIEWGGDWKSFKDGPHFQLPWTEYPG